MIINPHLQPPPKGNREVPNIKKVLANRQAFIKATDEQDVDDVPAFD